MVWKSIVLVMALLTGLMAQTTVTRAQVATCEEYAQLMLVFVQDAEKSRCRAITDDWGDSYGQHFNYCQRVTLPDAIATRERLVPVLNDCNRRHVVAVCEAYTLTMSTLQTRLLALCSRTKLGGYSTSTDNAFRQDCLAHSFGQEEWYLDRVQPMRDRIEACR